MPSPLVISQLAGTGRYSVTGERGKWQEWEGVVTVLPWLSSGEIVLFCPGLWVEKVVPGVVVGILVLV